MSGSVQQTASFHPTAPSPFPFFISLGLEMGSISTKVSFLAHCRSKYASIDTFLKHDYLFFMFSKIGYCHHQCHSLPTLLMPTKKLGA